MTNEELQNHLTALRASGDSGDIETKHGDDWIPVGRGWLNYHYRIRPQPREVWIAEGAFDSSGDTVGMAYRNPWHSVRYIKLREVLDD